MAAKLKEVFKGFWLVSFAIGLVTSGNLSAQEAVAPDPNGYTPVAVKGYGVLQGSGKLEVTIAKPQDEAAFQPEWQQKSVLRGYEFSPAELNRRKDASEQREISAPAEAELLEDTTAYLPEDSQPLFPPGAQAPILTSGFTGFSFTGWIPPDPIMAAGPSDIIVAVNSSWRIYNKTGGQLFNRTLSDWFANVLPTNRTGINVFDPWVLYDQISRRFILLALAKRDSDRYSHFLISVSDNGTAVGNWCNFALNARVNGSANTSNWADYTKVGITNNAVVLSANMFLFGANAFQYAKLRFIPKTTLYNTSCPRVSWWDLWDLRNADGSKAFTVQPAHSYVNSSTSYGLNSYSGGGNKLTLWRFTTPASYPPAPTLVRQATLATRAYTLAPNALQRGSVTRINTGDARLLNVIYRGSRLWTTHTVGCSWPGDSTNRSCIRWYEINPGTNGLLQQNSYGASGFHYYYPAISADNSRNAVVVFNRSGSNEYAGIRYTGRRSTDPVNTLQGSALLRAGQGCYVRLDNVGRNRWGDYNGIAIDPATGYTWIFSEYAYGTSATCTNNVWRTHVGRVRW